MHNFIDNSEVFFIAEMSGNHNQSFEYAKEIIDSAKKIGVNAIKFQTYTPRTLTINSDKDDFLIKDKNSIWTGERLYDLYQKAYTDWGWIKELNQYCNSINLKNFSSVFDISSIDFWEKLNPFAYKIASFENNHYELMKYAFQTNKPVIVSTGLASLEEIDEIVNLADKNNCSQLILMKCTSQYPADLENSNLLSIPFLANRYKIDIGYSDHTLGFEAALTSISLGAKIIEKHFTVDKTNKSVDSEFSADELDFYNLIKMSKNIIKALGNVSFEISSEEKKSIRFRRSIYAIKEISEGEEFNSNNIEVIRPGFGLHPKYLNKILNKTSKRNYQIGDPIKKDELE